MCVYMYLSVLCYFGIYVLYVWPVCYVRLCVYVVCVLYVCICGCDVCHVGYVCRYRIFVCVYVCLVGMLYMYVVYVCVVI